MKHLSEYFSIIFFIIAREVLSNELMKVVNKIAIFSANTLPSVVLTTITFVVSHCTGHTKKLKGPFKKKNNKTFSKTKKAAFSFVLIPTLLFVFLSLFLCFLFFNFSLSLSVPHISSVQQPYQTLTRTIKVNSLEKKLSFAKKNLQNKALKARLRKNVSKPTVFYHLLSKFSFQIATFRFVPRRFYIFFWRTQYQAGLFIWTSSTTVYHIT